MSVETETKAETQEESKLKKELRQYYKKTFDAFAQAKLDLDYDVPWDVRSRKGFVEKFLSRAKEDKSPILKVIRTMKRISIVIRDDKTGKATKKEYLEINSDLHGKDWQNNNLQPVEYFEGYHHEPRMTTTVKTNFETGEPIYNTQHQGNTKIYDIELTDKNRKQVIQDIINNATGTYVDEIKFYGDFIDSPNGPSFRCNLYTFDQFLNNSMEELERLGRKPGGPQGNAPIPNKENKGYHG